MLDLNDFRRQKDAFFHKSSLSPLTDEQRPSFEGLKYFPFNKALNLLIKIEPFTEQDEIQIQTNTGDMQIYLRYGRFTFEVEGEEASLTLYHNDNGFFLPFVDGLAGGDTYPAGRYLDVEQLPNSRFYIDFNLAYNPYCAYNERWSCPITPAENRVSVAIRAGEKLYKPGSE